MSKKLLNIDIELGTKYLINESAYFLGGILAANESVIVNEIKYWIAPVRHNKNCVTNIELEDHYNHVKRIAASIEQETLMDITIRENGFNSGKFPPRMTGFGTFFKSQNSVSIEEMIPIIRTALFASSKEIRRCFIVGMFDGRGALDRDTKSGKIRQIALDCENRIIGEFLCEVLLNYGLSHNYNISRARLEGGTPRKDQIRVLGSEDYIGEIGFVSSQKFNIATQRYRTSGQFNIVNEDNILYGLKISKESR